MSGWPDRDRSSFPEDFSSFSLLIFLEPSVEVVAWLVFEGGTTPLKIAVTSHDHDEMLQSLSGEIIQISGTLKIKRSRFHDEHNTVVSLE
eukprot:scaffold3460_cov93-Skeletonema_dohrnii-CCMP3373.AAC.7